MRRPRAPELGFTVLEMMLGVVLAGVVIASATSVLGTTTGLLEDEMVRLEDVRNVRNGLEAISNVLQAADLTTLDGFDEDSDLAVTPSFRRVTGAEDGLAALGPTESLEWRAGATYAPGNTQLGGVWLVSPAGDRLLVDHVPEDTFLVEQQGRSLTIRLGSHAGRDAGHAPEMTRWVVVSVRNAQ